MRIVLLLVLTLGTVVSFPPPAAGRPRIDLPVCEAEPGRGAELVQGTVSRGGRFTATTPSDWILRLAPQPEGWSLEIATVGRNTRTSRA